LSEIGIDEVFVLRLWREAIGPAAGFQWRAQVTHVNSGDRRTANSVDEALALIRAGLEAAAVGRGRGAS
jgi:hypothetical protein